MRTRQIITLLLAVALLSVAFPAVGSAAVHGIGADSGQFDLGSFFARVVEWLQGLIQADGAFVATQGATTTSGG